MFRKSCLCLRPASTKRLKKADNIFLLCISSLSHDFQGHEVGIVRDRVMDGVRYQLLPVSWLLPITWPTVYVTNPLSGQRTI